MVLFNLQSACDRFIQSCARSSRALLRFRSGRSLERLIIITYTSPFVNTFFHSFFDFFQKFIFSTVDVHSVHFNANKHALKPTPFALRSLSLPDPVANRSSSESSTVYNQLHNTGTHINDTQRTTALSGYHYFKSFHLATFLIRNPVLEPPEFNNAIPA